MLQWKDVDFDVDNWQNDVILSEQTCMEYIIDKVTTDTLYDDKINEQVKFKHNNPTQYIKVDL